MRFLPIVVILFSMKFPAVAQDGVAPEVCKIVERIKEDERPTWTYEVLAANSDLIVVASLADRQEVAADIVGKTDFDRESTRRFSNKLNVLSVLKGALDTEVHVITTEWAPKTTVLGLKTSCASDCCFLISVLLRLTAISRIGESRSNWTKAKSCLSIYSTLNIQGKLTDSFRCRDSDGLLQVSAA